MIENEAKRRERGPCKEKKKEKSKAAAYKTLMSSDVVGSLPINIDVN